MYSGFGTETFHPEGLVFLMVALCSKRKFHPQLKLPGQLPRLLTFSSLAFS
jgi:hypothetical protein